MRFRVLDSISSVPAAEWNALGAGASSLDHYPFLRHEFLQALEEHGCATIEAGWQPHHLIGEDAAGTLVAAAPLYLKSHSYGEFVFDFAWAEASHRLGRAYYPKLLNAVPFNPVTGPRLLARDATSRFKLAQAIRTHVESVGLSSAHALFLNDADRDAYANAGFLLRKDCHYQWFNAAAGGYRDFADFANHLGGRRRKEVLRERRKVHEAGIQFQIFAGADLPEALWPLVYRCYARTYHQRGQDPYLSPECLQAIGTRLGDQVRLFVAFRENHPIAAAYMLHAGDTLYGRHWGCLEEHSGLHFETCYYQGIEYCITHKLARFDAGAQGEHKLRRGFTPIATWSAHWLAEPRLRDAVASYLNREMTAIDEYIAVRGGTVADANA